MEVIELSLCDTEIPHLVEAHGYCPDGEGLEWLHFQSVHKVTGTYTDGQMRVEFMPVRGPTKLFT